MSVLGIFKGRKNKSEGILRLLEQRMIAIEMAGEGIGIANSDGAISFVNKAFSSMYGYPGWQALDNKNWFELIDSGMRNNLMIQIKECLSEGKTWGGSTTGIKMNGDKFNISLLVSGLPDGRWIFLVRDITEQTKLEESARHRLAAIEAARDGIGLVDKNGHLLYMNRALKTLHEFNDEDEKRHIGQSWTNLYTEVGRRQIENIVMPILKKDGYWKGESSVLTKTGKVVQAELSLTLLDDGGLIGTARDVTERVNAQKEHEKLQRQFYQAQKMEAIGRLSGGIAHDFNNLLASIMGYSEFLMDDLSEDSKQYGFARSIHEGSIQARNVVERLLMFSRSHDHKLDHIDMDHLISTTIDLVRSSFPSTISIAYKSQPGAYFINGDPTLISQILMNLYVNARDAIGTNQDHGHVSVVLSMRTYNKADYSDGLFNGKLIEGDEYVVVQVTDSGCGMDTNVMNHIFDPFFTTKPVDQGTGLGLATVHGIVQSHKGAIFVQSTLQVGSCFTLLFPKESTQRIEEPKATVERQKTSTGNLRVILVEDQEDVRSMLEIMLARLGCQTFSCMNGFAAIDHLREHPGQFDLLITDQTMPGMTGAELSRQVSEDFPDLPIILMSGFSEESLANLRRDNSSIQAVIRKPIAYETLVQAINEAAGT